MKLPCLPIIFSITASGIACSLTIPSLSIAQPQNRQNPLLIEADDNTPTPGVSPTRRINRRQSTVEELTPLDEGFRSFDGYGNNLSSPEMGAAHTLLMRLVPADYSDGVDAIAGTNRPSPRAISNAVSAQSESIPNRLNASDYVWQWGQFLDHDLDLTDGIDPPENEDIPVPAGDPFFDPTGTGNAIISFNRSLYDLSTGTDLNNARQQINEITAWIDASNVYGSDSERALALRSNDGSGRLKTSTGNLLPFNIDGLANAGGDSASLFLAGDVRANEQVGLAAMHTLFVREHNRLADRIRNQSPNSNGEEIYERARRIVGAQMQAITYKEYLPALLGANALAPYTGYQPDVDAAISNLFATASYRYGHSALSPTLLRLDGNSNEIDTGHLALQDAFFSPQRLTDEGGIAPLLRGLAHQVCQRVDPYVIDDVRNFLFGPPGAGGFDLVSLNIQRGRDHGLPSYNDVREALNLGRLSRFVEVTSDTELQARLASIYASVDDIDVWVGGLAEDPLPGALVGRLIFTVLKDQFEALRDGDRYWYQRVLPSTELERVENTRLADIIRRNTAIRAEIPNDVFHVSQDQSQTGPGNPGQFGGPRQPGGPGSRRTLTP